MGNINNKTQRLVDDLRELGIEDDKIDQLIDTLYRLSPYEAADRNDRVMRSLVSYLEPSLVLKALSEITDDTARADLEQ